MKAYIGDGAYIQFDGFGLILTTEDGVKTTNTIYLEPYVYQNLVKFAESCSSVPNPPDAHAT